MYTHFIGFIYRIIFIVANYHVTAWAKLAKGEEGPNVYCGIHDSLYNWAVSSKCIIVYLTLRMPDKPMWQVYTYVLVSENPDHTKTMTTINEDVTWQKDLVTWHLPNALKKKYNTGSSLHSCKVASLSSCSVDCIFCVCAEGNLNVHIHTATFLYVYMSVHVQ